MRYRRVLSSEGLVSGSRPNGSQVIWSSGKPWAELSLGIGCRPSGSVLLSFRESMMPGLASITVIDKKQARLRTTTVTITREIEIDADVHKVRNATIDPLWSGGRYHTSITRCTRPQSMLFLSASSLREQESEGCTTVGGTVTQA